MGVQPEAAQGRSASDRRARGASVEDPATSTRTCERFPRELSGGQRQRVAMGRAIVRDPKVFLFDEPLSNLDAKLRVAMRAEIKALHQRLKTTTVYVTHDQVEAMTMADRIVVMHDGRIEQIGDPLATLRPSGQPVRRAIHRLAGDERRRTARQRRRRRQRIRRGRRWRALAAAARPRAPKARRSRYGVRPEHSTLASAERDGAVPAEIIVVEPTGAETELR